MKVLIAVDDDKPSREALAFAERLLTERDEVVVLNVTSYSELVPFTGDPFGAGIGAVALDPESLAQLDDRAEQLVERTADEIDDFDPGIGRQQRRHTRDHEFVVVDDRNANFFGNHACSSCTGGWGLTADLYPSGSETKL